MKVAILVSCMLVAVALASQPVPRVERWSREAIPKHWSLVGTPEATETVSFIAALPQRNLDVLESTFWAVSTPESPFYRDFLTNDKILDIIAPEAEVQEIVLDFFVANGCKCENRGDAIKCESTVAVAEAIFQTKFYLFMHDARHKTIVRQLGPVSLPAHVSQHVELISGIADFPVWKKSKIAAKATPGAAGGQPAIIPATVNKVYSVPSGASASLTSQGVIEFGAGEAFDPTDLATFAQQAGVTIAPLAQKNIVNLQPPTGDEGTLDIQWIASFGVGSTNWYWTENDWLYDFGNNFFAATDFPEVISVSYGWAEYDQCTIDPTQCQNLNATSYAYVARVNTEFQKIGLKGVSILVASGDSGANGRDDEYCSDPELHPDFPAASPYVTSVGATQLNSPDYNNNFNQPICQTSTSGYSCISGGTEVAVSYDVASFASGGGFSNVAAMPSYQTAAVSKYFSSGAKLPPASYFNKTGRGYPDICSFGTQIIIYESGLESIGGTSASSPTVAGLMSLLNQVAHSVDGKPLGFLNPLLYKMQAEDATTFHDVTVGDNKCTESGCQPGVCQGYVCAPGWDPVSGLGSPSVTNMIAFVQKMLKK